MKIESRIGKIQHPDKKIFDYISDFRNFDNIIPQDKVSEWDATAESCSFKMDMLGKVKLNIVEKNPNAMVKIGSDPDVSQYNFTLWFQIKEAAPGDSRVKITIEPKLNMVLMGMVKKPLKEFVNSLMDEIENFKFNEEASS